MKKQTKLVAVLSASALLAMGASMTSFAATGWTQEGGTWYYYAKDGSRVTDEWKKSGNYWFYLGDDGEMVTDQLIEDDDDYYYVNQDGAMVTNGWVAVDNEDAGDEDEPDQYWYYFQNNGKSYKGSDNGSTTRFKTINGKKYAFDEEGRMLFGWVSDDGERQTGDDAWTDAVYYLGDENDGAMATGWRLINILDESWPDDNETYDEDQDRYFYFKSNGKRYANTGDKEYVAKTIDGKKYGFDENGRMIAEWNIATVPATDGQAAYTRQWAYFSSPEDGARLTKGWFKVIPDEKLDDEKYNDAEEQWYYSDGKGLLYANVVKTIGGRKYAFDEYGRMMDGLRMVQFAKNGNHISTKDIADSWKDDQNSSWYFDTKDNLETTVRTMAKGGWHDTTFMYFGDDGSIKTGKQTITIDGDKIDFEFNKNGSQKGWGRSEIDEGDKVAYSYGMKYKADSDNKYEIILKLKGEVGGEFLLPVTAQEYINALADQNGKNGAETEYISKKSNGNDDNKYYFGKDGLLNDDKEKVNQSELKKYTFEDAEYDVKGGYVVNTSGSLIKKKNKCKDGDDYIIEVGDRFQIKAIYEELD